MSAKRIGVISGAFNPVTKAHLALTAAAQPHVDEIVFAIPRAFPHKEYGGASLEHRLEMLKRSSEHRIQITDGGLYIDIAREIRQSRRDSLADADIFIICGRDAAERVVAWDYPEPDSLDRMFQEFHLLVADRQGEYQPPDHLRSRIHALALPPHFNDVSSSEVRRRIAVGEPWEHLVPESIIDLVSDIYGDGRRRQ